MQTRLLLDFAENEAKSKDPKQRNIQYSASFSGASLRRIRS